MREKEAHCSNPIELLGNLKKKKKMFSLFYPLLALIRIESPLFTIHLSAKESGIALVMALVNLFAAMLID